MTYFFTYKKGRMSGANPSFGRKDGDEVIITQKLALLIMVPSIIAILFSVCSIGYFSMQIGIPENIAKLIFWPALACCIVFMIWGMPRFIHLKVIRDHLDKLEV